MVTGRLRSRGGVAALAALATPGAAGAAHAPGAAHAAAVAGCSPRTKQDTRSAPEPGQGGPGTEKHRSRAGAGRGQGGRSQSARRGAGTDQGQERRLDPDLVLDPPWRSRLEEFCRWSSPSREPFRARTQHTFHRPGTRRVRPGRRSRSWRWTRCVGSWCRALSNGVRTASGAAAGGQGFLPPLRVLSTHTSSEDQPSRHRDSDGPQGRGPGGT